MSEKISEDKGAAPALRVDCPRCAGTGKIAVDHVANLAAKALEEHRGGKYGLIQAIKTLRDWTGCTLREAKDAIEEAQHNSVADSAGGVS